MVGKLNWFDRFGGTGLMARRRARARPYLLSRQRGQVRLMPRHDGTIRVMLLVRLRERLSTKQYLQLRHLWDQVHCRHFPLALVSAWDFLVGTSLLTTVESFLHRSWQQVKTSVLAL